MVMIMELVMVDMLLWPRGHLLHLVLMCSRQMKW